MCHAGWPRKYPVSVPGTWFWCEWFGGRLIAPSYIPAVPSPVALLPMLLPPLFWFRPCDFFLHLSAAVPLSSFAPSLPFGWPCMPLQHACFPKPALLRFSMTQGPSIASCGLKPKLLADGKSPSSSGPPFPAAFRSSLPCAPSIKILFLLKMKCGAVPSSVTHHSYTLFRYTCGWHVCPIKDSVWMVRSTSYRVSLAEYDFCSALY